MADTLLRDFDKWANKVQREILAVRNGVVDRLQTYTIGLTNGAGDGTPVDTGNLQWNWWIGADLVAAEAAYQDVRKGKKKNKSTTIRRNRTLLRTIPVNKSVYFMNSSPYVLVIEYGGRSTIKAPNGMLRIAIKRLENDMTDIVREAIDSVKSSGFGDLSGIVTGLQHEADNLAEQAQDAL